jgi:hypothetical protein
MRRLSLAAAAVATFAGAGSLASTRVDAMPLPGAGGLGVAITGHELTEQVYLVCRRAWNGYRWVRTCYDGGPRYYGGGPSMYFGGGHHFGHHGGHGGGHHGGGGHGGGHH